MARIIKRSDDPLMLKSRRYNGISIFGLSVMLIGVILFAVFLFTDINFEHTAGAIFFLIIAVGFIVWRLFRKQAKILGAGVTGESDVYKLLAKLPDEYTVFCNIHITYEGRTNELDFVVVGPTGVTVVETKNRKGNIIGSYDEKYWTQRKLSKNGRYNDARFYSPIRQVAGQIYKLAALLKAAGTKTYVHGAAYFASPESTVIITGDMDKIPVFCKEDSGEEKLLRYIASRDTHLTAEQTEKIVNLLERKI